MDPEPVHWIEFLLVAVDPVMLFLPLGVVSSLDPRMLEVESVPLSADLVQS